MSRKYDAEMAILALCVLESSEDDELENEPKRKKRSVWQKKWLGRREKHGFCSQLLLELREEEPDLYRNVLRMSSAQFDHLVALVKPYIEKKYKYASVHSSRNKTCTNAAVSGHWRKF